MKYFLTVMCIIVIIQIIYLWGVDFPFHYNELLYNWNYSNTLNNEPRNSWLELEMKNKPGLCNSYNYNDNTLFNITKIQTDMFSYHSKNTIHYYSVNMLVFLMLMNIFYLLNNSLNTVLYEHEKKKI